MENNTRTVALHFNITHKNNVHLCRWSYFVRNPTSSFITNTAIVCVANAITAILGISLNLLIVVALWKSKKLRDKVTYFMIMISSITDLAVSGLVGPSHLIALASEMFENPRCVYVDCYHWLAYGLSGMSTVTYFSINGERYLSILFPALHRNLVTKTKCVLAAMVLWIIPLSLGFLERQFSTIVSVFMSVMVLGTVFIYLSIFVKVKAVLRRRHQEINTEHDSTTASNEMTRRELNLLRELKLTKTCFSIVLSCFVSYFPSTVVLVLWGRNKLLLSTGAEVHGRRWAEWTLRLNSTTNCLVLLWANTVLRKEAKKIIEQLRAF